MFSFLSAILIWYWRIWKTYPIIIKRMQREYRERHGWWGLTTCSGWINFLLPTIRTSMVSRLISMQTWCREERGGNKRICMRNWLGRLWRYWSMRLYRRRLGTYSLISEWCTGFWPRPTSTRLGLVRPRRMIGVRLSFTRRRPAMGNEWKIR